jgi:type II secretory pathway pseudopilin PulG
LAPLTLAPPEIAVIVAVPFALPALNVASARPPASVVTFAGSIVPSDVVKVTSVPECGGVPDASITCAISCVEPFTGKAVAATVSVIVEPDGARSGTFWQPAANTDTVRSAEAATSAARERRDIMKSINILIPMQLRGQGSRRPQAGYAMAALLVAMGIMAVMMTVAMPVWKQAAQREKEEELVFRGQQYVHAIGLFKRKFANASPPNLDLLVEQRFLRRKYKDPITNDDFQPLTENQATSGLSGQGTSTPGSTTIQGRGAGGAITTLTTRPSPSAPGASTSALGTSPIGTPGAGAAGGGIIGVTSKSKDKSIRLYNGRGHYNEWAFVFTQQQLQPPGVGGAGGVPGQRGQPQGGPGSGFPPGRGRGNGRGDQPNSPPGSRGSRGFGGTPDGRAMPIAPPTRGRGPGN